MVEVSLATLTVVHIISAGGGESPMPHTVAPHGDGVVVSDPEKHYVLNWSRCVGGNGTPGNNDGLFQPSCIKIFATLNKNAEFLKGIGELFSAFPLNEKQQTYKSCDFSGGQVLTGSRGECSIYQGAELLFATFLKWP